ncbi:hypothetical protein EV421DRAFT_1291872 [Armillaria borealis]|uniref:Clathrin/coatomer adaptor adaptin-like N-terminal domain-containing protein n=1 Tax=Armillaria borealis TaxID=47425 RepID=A0AA39JWI7_9AGAR|nr:hypothetical protein EV421DRAFT_1291872 [Armillaria borealis]
MPPRPPNWVIGAAAGAALTPVLAAGPVAGIVVAGVAGWVASWFGGEFDETQIVLASSDFFLGDELDPTLIRKQLDSDSVREKLDAMKRIIALMDKGHNVSKYFPQVAKNVDSQNLEIRKLVYIYLLKYVEDLSDGSSQEGSTGGASSEEEDVDKPSRSSVV